MMALSLPASPGPELPPRVRGYLDAIAQVCTRDGRGLVSIVLFGSAAKGGFARQVSDVDLIVVLPDGASREERARARDEVSRLEIDHGFKEPAGRLQGVFCLHQTLKRLLDLRGRYRKSFGFVLRCLPALLRLHLRTALDNSFPLDVRR
jgi:predicted nucleotidyltransferase